MSPYIFIPLSTLIFLSFNLYSYYVLKQNSILMRFKWSLRWFFIILFAFEFAYFIALKTAPLPASIYQISILCIGVSFILFCTIVPFHIALFFISKFSRSKQRIYKFIVDISVILGFILYFGIGVYNANFNTIITTQTIKLKGLNAPLNAVLITDVHIGQYLQKNFLNKVVTRINLLRPDIVFIVGDLADLNSDEIGDSLDPLKDISSKYGTYVVVGNHEYYHGVDGLIDKFKSLNLNVLENQNLQVANINLAGVYDITGFRFNHHKPDFKKALSNLDPAKPTILLTHQPKSLKYLDQNVDLALFGHTHGGQIFPFSFLAYLDQKYLYGLYKINKDMQIYVSSGVGFWGPPLRVGTNSEIVYLRLQGE